ncbi:MAG TPA: ABC transporter permease, partial [Isoptericola sp.]|nr:ABC transporter permease [Isoptericola sp.]
MTAVTSGTTLDDARGTQPASPERGRAKRRREAGAGFAFLSPWLVGFVVLTAFPMVASLYLAFTDYDLFRPPSWVGTENFTKLFD